MSFHTKTLVDGHRMFRCIARNFLFNFLIFLNAFKMYFHNRCICSYEPKHHVSTDVIKANTLFSYSFIIKVSFISCMHGF
jgi:hypothetical protein